MLLTVLHYHSRQRKRNWDPTSLVAGGRADSGPVQGAGSLVQQQPIEEQGRPAEGDVLRGPDHGACTRECNSTYVGGMYGCVRLKYSPRTASNGQVIGRNEADTPTSPTSRT